MQKEKIITIAIGLLIGIAVAGFFFFSKKLNPANPSTKIEIKQEATTSAVPANTFNIITPIEGFVSPENTIKIEGSGQIGSTIVIVSNTQESKTTIGDDGKFSATVKLEEGENRIQIINLVPNKDPQVITRTISLDI